MRVRLSFLLASFLLISGCRSPAKESVDLLVRGGAVLTMDPEWHVYDPGFVEVHGDRIADLGPLAEAPSPAGARVLQAQRRIIIPGLVNGHQHAAMILMSGVADDLKLMQWLQKVIFPVESQVVDADYVYWATLLAVLRMVESGTTTYADMYYFEDRVAEATASVGMRGVLGETVIGFPAPDYATPQETLKATEAFIRKWKGHRLITPAVAPHSAYTCSRQILEACEQLAEKYDVPLLTHLAETREEVAQVLKQTHLRPVAYLEQLGLLTPRLVAAHAVWVNADEIELLARRGVGIIHNPESNMKLASGVAPIPEMLAAGLHVGLGTDGPASNNNLDMLEEMDTAAKLQKVTREDPTVIPARQALAMATIEGARALGLGKQIGSLEPGKKADLVVLSPGSNAPLPLYNYYSAVVYALEGSSVESVIIDGRLVLEHRRFPGVDVREVARRAREYQRKIAALLEKIKPG